ncbi:MAG TPA: hypothetical protein PKE12_11840 [Kiritimatiellia bacterium]|nr:hypothetical protein [Kiritimatiellia bacterium]
MTIPKKGPARARRGQAMMEYVLVMGTTVGVLVMMALLLYAFKEYGGRIINLIASEYP